MDNPPIHVALYAELLRIQREIRVIEKEKMKLEVKLEVLKDGEGNLRCLMRDYGDFIYEDYKPKEKEEPDNG